MAAGSAGGATAADALAEVAAEAELDGGADDDDEVAFARSVLVALFALDVLVAWVVDCVEAGSEQPSATSVRANQ